MYSMNRLLLLVFTLFCHQVHGQAITWISACSDKTFCLNQNSCDEGDVLMFETAVTSCFSSQFVGYSYRIDLFNNGGLDIQSSADTVTGPFPFGTHKITWRATDNCGNLAQCTYLFTIQDCTPPALLCISGLSQNLEINCTTDITAGDFILNVSDNCTPVNELEFGMRESGNGSGFPTETTVSFDSCDIGEHNVEIWVKDGDGLVNQCNSVITVQDNDNGSVCVCGIGSDVALQGCARTGANTRLDSFILRADLAAVPAQGAPYTLPLEQTEQDSCFNAVFSTLPLDNDYQVVVRARRDDNPLNGVSTFDLLQTSLHILNVQPFQSLYQWIAADVNLSGSVTTFDIVETRKLILGIYDTFPKAPSWRFVRPLANPANFMSAVRDTYLINLPGLAVDTLIPGLDFVGVKMGDTNLSAHFSGDADDRSALTVALDDILLDAGSEVLIPFFPDGTLDLNGWQIALRVDPYFAEITGLDGVPAENYHLDGGGLLRALWFDAQTPQSFGKTPLFSMKVKILRSARLSEILSQAQAELAGAAFEVLPGGVVSARNMAFRFNAVTGASARFFPPAPNPFSTKTEFGLQLSGASTVVLEVFDLSGKNVYAETMAADAGFLSLPLPSADLPGSGLFLYRISTGDEVFSGKIWCAK